MDMIQRPRRLRSGKILRDLCSEVNVDPKKLIMPYFIRDGKNIREQVVSMPGIERVSAENILNDLEADLKLGIRSVLLFGIPDKKDEKGSGAYSPNGVVQKTIREIKKKFKDDIFVISDVCLCEYTSHGHCGVIKGNSVDNDSSLELIAETALTHAAAGADMVAPSDMMDGRVSLIRDTLDEEGFSDTSIMSYSAKYSSAFYGPFREAAGSTPAFGDRSAYQMDCRNGLEAEREVLLDIEEGADVVMVKPALSYLDIIHRVKNMSNVPVCAYNVSGEYSMVKTAAKAGFVDERRITMEILTSIFRAGADMAISYHTREILKNRWL